MMRYKSSYLADAQVFGATSHGLAVPGNTSPFSSFASDEKLSARQRRRFSRMHKAWLHGFLSGETEARPHAGARCSALILRAVEKLSGGTR